jgi:hypothetical protein
MGAWDSGPFDNDDALDFLGDLEESPNVRFVLAGALAAAVESSGYLEAPEGSVAVAAAALVAVVHAGRASGVSDSIAERIRALRLTDDDASDLIPAAGRALDRAVGSESELLGLWEDAGSGDEWRETLSSIRDGLAS